MRGAEDEYEDDPTADEWEDSDFESEDWEDEEQEWEDPDELDPNKDEADDPEDFYKHREPDLEYTVDEDDD